MAVRVVLDIAAMTLGKQKRGLKWEKGKQGCSEKKGIGLKRKVANYHVQCLGFVLR